MCGSAGSAPGICVRTCLMYVWVEKKKFSIVIVIARSVSVSVEHTPLATLAIYVYLWYLTTRYSCTYRYTSLTHARLRAVERPRKRVPGDDVVISRNQRRVRARQRQGRARGRPEGEGRTTTCPSRLLTLRLYTQYTM